MLPMLCLCVEYRKALETYLKRDDWYMWAHMFKGGITMPVFQSLDAYWPGLLVRMHIGYGGILW